MGLHAAGRAFDIHDLDAAIIHQADIQTPISLHTDVISFLNQSGDECRSLFLQQGLATGNGDIGATVRPQTIQDIPDFQKIAAFIGVFCIAILTAQIASGEPHKTAQQARPQGFSLNTEKNLVD